MVGIDRTSSQDGLPCPWGQMGIRTPDRPALYDPRHGAVTWQEMEHAIQQAEHVLAAIPSGPVAYEVAQDLTDIAAIIACLRQDRDVLLMGSRTPPSERARILSQHEARQLELPAAREADVGDPNVPVPGPNVTLRGATRVRTSGSTGAAKWIRHRPEAHMASARAVASRLDLSEQDRWGWCLPAHHVGGLSILFRCTSAGAAVIVKPRGQDICSWLEELPPEHMPTLLSVVPTQLQDLVQGRLEPPEQVRSVIVGGAAISSQLMRAALEKGWSVRTTYGMTETGSMVTLSGVWTVSGDIPEGPLHVGRVLDHADLSCRDGRILIQTKALGEGLAEESGWFVSSDRGFQDERGRWTIEGRADRVIISGGENLDPHRIERAICDVEGIHSARVIGVPDPRYGERPVAFIAGPDLIPDRAWFSERLSGVLQSFEIPDLFLPLPKPEEGHLKPSHDLLMRVAARAADATHDEKLP